MGKGTQDSDCIVALDYYYYYYYYHHYYLLQPPIKQQCNFTPAKAGGGKQAHRVTYWPLVNGPAALADV